VSEIAACYREYKLIFGETTKFADLTLGEVTFGKMTTVGKITFGEMAFSDMTFVEITSKTSNAKKSKHCTILRLLCRYVLGLR